jgi:3-phenylpropionate/trans-cinnamate dioxygenase ferredoxin reductase subunit
MSVLIVGGGHGGATAAIELRRIGYLEPITIVGDERVIPYQRPPLSKAWLKGQSTHDDLVLRPHSWYRENGVELLLDSAVIEIDRAQRRVRLAGGRLLEYSDLVIATGARARRLSLPGADLGGVLTLRSTEDADRIKNALRSPGRMAVIGGGYIGLEIAASARGLGADITIVEREERVLARVACRVLSEFFTRIHRERGIHFELGVDIVRFLGTSQVEGVQLADGRKIPCDVAIVGVGAAPNDSLARDCGLECSDGIVVDSNARTSDEHIFAVGDVTRRPLARYGRKIRLESVPNAIEQARQAAAAISHREPSPDEVPWFWSDQYDVKLQIAGLSLDCVQNVVRGDPNSDSFSVFHLQGNQVEAVEAVNRPGEFMFAKKLIGGRGCVDPRRLADSTVPLRDIMV